MTQLSGRRIAVLTTGHLATSPRMTKAADAFAEAGATVHMISTRSTPWAVEGDSDIVRRRPGAWQWHVVDYRRESKAIYLRSGSRQRLAIEIARRMNPDKLPLWMAAAARERVFPEIVATAKRLNVDFIYGGGAGLGAAYFAARALNVPFGVDLEDFHTGDQVDTPAGRLVHALSGRIERDVLPKASLRTAGSRDIADAYRAQYHLDFVPIDNAFATDTAVRSRTSEVGPLRLYWFSQTIGPGRGLEDAIAAASLAEIDAELHLQGVPMEGYLESLNELVAKSSRIRIVHHEPCHPDEIVRECARYDVGLALERSDIPSRDLCLTNKALAYAAAGMALILTDTRGQLRLGKDLGAGAGFYHEGDSSTFANLLSRWFRDRQSLQEAKDATFAAALHRWNWNDAQEKPRLVNEVANQLGGVSPRA